MFVNRLLTDTRYVYMNIDFHAKDYLTLLVG